MKKTYIDNKNNFREVFDTENGNYIRTGIIENGIDTEDIKADIKKNYKRLSEIK